MFVVDAAWRQTSLPRTSWNRNCCNIHRDCLFRACVELSMDECPQEAGYKISSTSTREPSMFVKQGRKSVAANKLEEVDCAAFGREGGLNDSNVEKRVFWEAVA